MSGHGLTLWMNGATSKSSVSVSVTRALSVARAAESEANSISTDASLLVVSVRQYETERAGEKGRTHVMKCECRREVG